MTPSKLIVAIAVISRAEVFFRIVHKWTQKCHDKFDWKRWLIEYFYSEC